MSGVGEALAIVSCVGGLVQAIDAGQRIVKQIKDRRQAHRSNGALPPSEQLEQTLASGRQEIEKLVHKGQQRFGSDFEADETARVALLQVTVQIQNALLNRLTEARTDDGVIDFDECIDLSDQGCNDALVALQALYKRKLEEDMERKQRMSAASKEIVQVQAEALAQSPTTKAYQEPTSPPTRMPTQDVQSNTSKQRAAKEAAPLPVAERKKARAFSLNPFTSRTKTEAPPSSTRSPPALERSQTASPKLALQRRSTTASDMSSDSPVKRFSISSESSHSTAGAPKQDASNPAWTIEMSRASTLMTVSSAVSSGPTLAKYSGSCKYAYKARDKGYKDGLSPVNLSMHFHNWVYQCKSSNCRYQALAIRDKAGVRLDDTIRTSHGIRYRAIFLAKSHVAYKENSQAWPYICLFCLWAKIPSEVYYDINNLMKHVSLHKEPTIGLKELPMEGPLVFSNMDVSAVSAFDVELPYLDQTSLSPTAQHNPDRVVDMVQKRLEAAGLEAESKPSERVLSKAEELRVQSDPFANPWA
ncbi:uncharacterized protein HMPREF1541_05736 [Cyphellophora europaea CBS 101466]|uniref:Uncharacterized protein n=1 Tax=Cyphellophora europaea (strain CBS 101466) TaxID=1220924 RepID=W2RT65_CYPE1|nr:uncharacterized protein HMPREF1541_05736 [Cyphellophora europaea CBS 101466]ETN39510.1 hypothetical protein HMPREF1541_05736 [Cyphellophora europaea CBS 101466]